MLRLGAMWPGIEPLRGEYNESYLAALQTTTFSPRTRGRNDTINSSQAPSPTPKTLHNNLSASSTSGLKASSAASSSDVRYTIASGSHSGRSSTTCNQ